jgi:hypothetical protein
VGGGEDESTVTGEGAGDTGAKVLKVWNLPS